MKNSYYENAAFVRGSLTNEAREVVTDRLFSIIEDGMPGDAIMAISHLFSLRNELSFGYKSVEAEDATVTYPSTEDLKKQDLSHLEKEEILTKEAKDFRQKMTKQNNIIREKMVATLDEMMSRRERMLLSDYAKEDLQRLDALIFEAAKKLKYI